MSINSRQRKMMIVMAAVLLSLAGMSALLASAAPAAPAAVFNVNSFGDAVDASIDGTCETGANNGICTLRAAIMEANHLSAAAVISGPVGGLINTLLTYTATVSPLTATQPITFVWTATGQANVTHTAASPTDSVSFQWSTAGSQLLNVTARSAAGLAQGSYGVTIGNPLPVLSGISPTMTLAGGSDFTLTVTGANFVPGSAVRWNGFDRATTFIGAGELQTLIPAADIAARGTVAVTVFSPGPGGGESSPQNFAIWSALYVPLVAR